MRSDQLAENCTVVIHSIGARPELNGQTATVQRHDAATGRIVVRLDGGEQVKLKPEKLRPFDGGSAPQPALATALGNGGEDLPAELSESETQARDLENKLKDLQAQQEPPRHIGQGILNGVGAAAAGIAAGAVGLVAAPIAGAAEEGGVGFIKGLAVGAAGAIAMPALGVAAGVSQVVQGAMNTPDAVNAQLDGEEWDQASRKYVKVLPFAIDREEQELSELEAAAAGASAGAVTE